MIEHALEPVTDELAELTRRMPSYVPTQTHSGRAVISHVFGSGGKRIRPALYFMCCRLLGYNGDHLYPIGAVTEFVHTASLLHDDVVDNSSLRRNKPTASSIYGDETAVLVGDLIYSTASEMMAATGNMEIVKTFARAIRLMSDGELLQLESLFKPSLSVETYLRILECKTSILIEAACKSAGLLSGAPAAVTQELGKFGHGVGMAFQLIDDALDYVGSMDLVGKATLSDLKEGKVTMPVILLRDHATSSDLMRLQTIIGSEAIDDDMVQEVARMVDRYDTAVLTVDHAHTYTRGAMNALMTLPASIERDVLENLANKLLFRFN